MNTRIMAVALVCGGVMAISDVKAATITVTTDSGGIGGPDCTLRDAITAANTDTASGGCPAGDGADTIELPAGATITLTVLDNFNEGRNGLPSITSEITISGNGATIERSLADGTPDFRICVVSDELILNDITIVNGEAFGNFNGGLGGGLFISVGATALLADVSVIGNLANFAGGGISVSGSSDVTLTNCIISENSAGIFGGGISNANFDIRDLSLTNTTVCGNTPDQIFGCPWADNGGNLILNFCAPCRGDLDDDGAVGPIDLAILLGSWGPCEGCPADFDSDGDVDAADLAQLLGAWGSCP